MLGAEYHRQICAVPVFNSSLKIRLIFAFKTSLYARTLYNAVYVYLKTISRMLSNGGTLDDIRNGSAIIFNSTGTYEGSKFKYGFVIKLIIIVHSPRYRWANNSQREWNMVAHIFGLGT